MNDEPLPPSSAILGFRFLFLLIFPPLPDPLAPPPPELLPGWLRLLAELRTTHLLMPPEPSSLYLVNRLIHLTKQIRKVSFRFIRLTNENKEKTKPENGRKSSCSPCPTSQCETERERSKRIDRDLSARLRLVRTPTLPTLISPLPSPCRPIMLPNGKAIPSHLGSGNVPVGRPVGHARARGTVTDVRVHGRGWRATHWARGYCSRCCKGRHGLFSYKACCSGHISGIRVIFNYQDRSHRHEHLSV